MLKGICGICLLIFAAASGVQAQSYSISTVAGSDRLGDGGPATASLLRRPVAVAADGAGNVYVSDIDDSRVRAVNSSGIISTFAGDGFSFFFGDGGPADQAEIAGVTALAAGPAGELYLADYFNNRIRKVSPSGIITTVAGNGKYPYVGDGVPATSTGIDPYSVAVDAGGNLYIADLANFRIRKVTPNGIISTFAGTGVAGSTGDGGLAVHAQINVCSSVAVDAAGNVYLTDYTHNKIRKVDSAGIITTVAGNGSHQYSGDSVLATSAGMEPFGIAVDSNGDLYIADRFNNRIRKVTVANGMISTVAGKGDLGFAGDGGLATGATLSAPSSINFDSAGNLYIADKGNYRVRKVSLDQKIQTVAGSGVNDGGAATAAYLNFPSGSAIDGQGNLYIADSNDNRIRMVTPSGAISTFAGRGIDGFGGDGGPASSALLSQPSSVAIDANGNLYIADTTNFRIRKVTPSGVISTVAGTGEEGFTGDQGAATGAQIGTVLSIAVDAAGAVYIGDLTSNRVRKIIPGGAISTVAGNGNSAYMGDGMAATAAQFLPFGIAVDGAGNLYIADIQDHRVRKIDHGTGLIATIAGTGTAGTDGDGGPANAAQIARPTAVAVDAKGNVFIADRGNALVRRIDSDGKISIIAGSGFAEYSGDGGPALGAQLDPLQLTLDGAGDIFVADLFNDRVRKLRPLVAAQVVVASGNDQSGTAGAPLGSPLVVTVTNSDGLPVPGVTVNFVVTSGDATLSAASVVTGSDGTAQVQVTLGNTTGAVVVTATASGIPPVVFHITATVAAPPPAISDGGVVSAGLSVPAITAMSTNSIMTAFGQNFAPAGTFKQVKAADLVDGKLPTNFAGVCVLENSAPAPIFAVLPGQINFQSMQTPASGTVTVQVVTGCGTANELRSSTQAIPVQAAAPEFFYFKQALDGKNPIAAINAVTGVYVGTPGLLAGATFVPAAPIDVLTLFFTGGGGTNPAFAAGQLPDKSAKVTGAVEVTVGGVKLAAGDILYVGVTPHNAGLYQLNIRLPIDTPAGDLPVSLSIGGAPSSPGGFISVHR